MEHLKTVTQNPSARAATVSAVGTMPICEPHPPTLRKKSTPLNISLVKYVLDDKFTKQCHKLLKPVTVNNGLADSLRMLLSNFNENDQNLTKLLLSAF